MRNQVKVAARRIGVEADTLDAIANGRADEIDTRTFVRLWLASSPRDKADLELAVKLPAAVREFLREIRLAMIDAGHA